MLRNLGLDLDLSKVGKDVKLQLALPNKTIKKNITNVTQANLDGVEINGLPKLTFEIPHKIQKRVGTTDEIETIDNPDIKMIKEKMLIKVTWYNKKRTNWFRVTTITQTDSQDFVNMRVEADALQSELRATNVTTSDEPMNAVEYFTHVLSQTTWKLGYISDKVKDTYRSFDDNKKTRYEAINNGLETFGAIAEWDEDNRILNILSISDIREFRGVVLKKENYVSSLEIESNADDIVTRLYVYGNEKKGIEKVNPTGMAYIEDFSYFMYPFERDTNKNVISHSDYMSDELCHAILDLKVLQDEYNPRIKDLQDKLNKAYGDLSKANMQLVELEGQLVTLEALLDTAKATNDLPLVAKREQEVQAKEIEIFDKKAEIKAIQDSIELWEKTIVSYQELISTTSFTQELQNELSLFIYEQEFSDDRYIEEEELYKAGTEQFDKYQRPVRTFNIELASFVNSIESQHVADRLQIGEEVLVKSTKLKTEYKSIVLGYNVDFKTGDYQLIISDNMDDINSLDKLASLIYKADSSSTILNNNKYKWDNVTSIKDEVEAWRDKEIKAVENRIIAGANESVVIDNRGIQAHNPDFPDERIIIQSGVVALSRDGGKTWSTSVTPYGVNAETIIGKIIAGNNLIITNDSGSFVIDQTGLTINMDDIHIMSGQSGSEEDMIQLWNNLLLTYDEIASDNLVNEYEKNQLEKQWTKIVNIHGSMVEQFIKGWKPLEETGVAKPIEYNEYLKAYEDLNKYLNIEKQTDGFALLDKANRKVTSEIDPIIFAEKFKEYETKKQAFESIISMKFTKASIDIMEEGISLNYTKNKEIVTQLNLSEEGIRIDGKLLEINAETHFNADLIMNAGVIRDKDGGIIIDLNKGEVTLNKPITIGADSNLVSKDDLDKLELEAHTFVLTNDSAVVPTDKNGEKGDYSTASSSAFIYKGTQDITDKWKITTSVTVGVSGTLTGNTYTVTNMTKDTGVVTFIATMGNAELRKSFSISKAKAGLDGSEGKVRMLSLNADSYIMTFTNDLPKPDKQTVKVSADLIGVDKAITWKIIPVFGGKELLPLVKTPINNVIEITEKDLTGNIDLVKVTVTVDDLSDTVSIVKVRNGDGIKNTRVEYQIGDSGTTQPTGVWSIVLPQPVKGKYLWTRTTTTYTDDTKIETFSVSYYALDGQTGDDGVGVEKTVIEYQVGTSGTTAPTGTWTTTIPTVEKGSYLWTRTTITYTDKTTSISYSTSYSPKDGEKGTDSITGFLTNESISLSSNVDGLVSDYKNANGIFEVYDGITKKTGTSVKYSVIAQDSITVTIDANGKYVASGFATGKDKITASATLRAVYGGVTIDKQLTLSKAFTGATGSSASSYWVTPTVNVLATTPTGRINPEAIGFNAYTKSGTSNATVYNGRFIIETSIDGKAYTVRYTSTKDEPNCVYTVDIKAKFVKVKMYQAGATTYLLDEQTIPVLDIDGDIYQAWCNDVTDYKDFTRDYPNENLAIGTLTPLSLTGTGKDNEASTDGGLIDGVNIYVLDKKSMGNKVKVSVEYQLERDMPSGSEISMQLFGYPNWARICIISGKKAGKHIVTGELNIPQDTIPESLVRMRLHSNKYVGIVSANNTKVEIGDKFTIYTPSRHDNSPLYPMQYIGYSTKDSTNPKDFRWTPNADAVNQNVAWANSKDGSVDFTTVYPNENLLVKKNIDNLIIPMIDNNDLAGWNARVKIENPKIGDIKVTAIGDSDPYIRPVNRMPTESMGKVGDKYFLSFDYETPSTNYLRVRVINWSSAESTYYFQGKGSAVIGMSLTQTTAMYISFDPTTSKGSTYTVGDNFTLRKMKLEKSEVNTIYTDNIMKYIGYSTKPSQNYLDYKWSLASDGIKTYKAWADSEDGSINFGREYPNENLMKINSIKDYYNGYNGTVVGKTDYDATNVWGIQQATQFKATGGNAGLRVLMTSSNAVHEQMEMNLKYTHSIYIYNNGKNDFYLRYNGIIGDKEYPVKVGASMKIVHTGVRREAYDWFQVHIGTAGNANEINFVLANEKLEISETGTPYVASPKDSLVDSVMKYSGISVKDSNDPNDYEWVFSSEFAQAVSQVGIDTAQKIAEDAKNTADNAVQNEEFYSWLETDYKNQQKELQDISKKNMEDLAKVDERTVAIEQNLGRNKVKWNFIDNSFDFSEEGMFISNSKSLMRIQISSDKIVFWDNNVDVATITGEQLTIKRGLFLDSATIGNHVITKYSDTSSVTIIRYVGKV